LLLAKPQPTGGVAGAGPNEGAMKVAMRGRRKEYPLDVYKLGSALSFSCHLAFRIDVCPARVESTISGATVMLLSLAALIAFGNWEEWAALVMGCGWSCRRGC
jgi:hypothetical protein